jgi:hypothetical protein
MIAGRRRHTPGVGLRVIALKVFKNHFCKLDVFRLPLRFCQHHPIQSALRTFLERQGEERLHVPSDPHFGGRQPQPLPNQPHQSIGVRAACGITMAAGSKNQSSMLQCAGFRRNRACHLIGEALHQQGMPGIDIVMMQRNFGMLPPCLADGMPQSFALEQIEIERDGKDENFPSVSFRFLRDRVVKLVDRCQPDHWLKPQDRLTGYGYGASLITCFTPGFFPAVQIGSEDERRGQRSFPPIRPCLVIVANTSTMARTATSAVMSEIS